MSRYQKVKPGSVALIGYPREFASVLSLEVERYSGFESEIAMDLETVGSVLAKFGGQPQMAFVHVVNPQRQHLERVLALFPLSRVVMSFLPYTTLWAARAVRKGVFCTMGFPFSPQEAIAAAFDESQVQEVLKPANKRRFNLPTLDKVERDYVDSTLRLCEGNVSRAAAALGMARQSLQRKLRKNNPAR